MLRVAWDVPWTRPSSAPPRFGFKANWQQYLVASVLTCAIGFVLQIAKLAATDSAVRSFQQRSFASRASFLLPYAFAKAISNLFVGFAADRYGRKWPQVWGWALLLLSVPLVVGLPPTRGAWPLVILSHMLLGLQQGLCWSAAIFIFLDLAGREHAGLAVGLNETLGYSALALASLPYGALERTAVHCSWKHGADNVTAACSAAQGGTCAAPDAWNQDCIGQCICRGYYSRIYLVVALVAVGAIVLSVGALRDSYATHVHPWLRQDVENCGEKGEEGRMLVEMAGTQSEDHIAWTTHDHPSTPRAPPPSPPAPYSDDIVFPDPEISSTLRPADLQLPTPSLPERTPPHPRPPLEDASTPMLAGAIPLSHLPPTASDSSHAPDPRDPTATLPPAIPPFHESDALLPGPSLTSAGPPPPAAYALAAHACDPTNPTETDPNDIPTPQSAQPPAAWRRELQGMLAEAFALTAGNRSTAVMCLAGFVTNLLTGLAWGLVLAWARDSLGLFASQRNLLAASYDFTKGLTQFLTGVISDRLGRKAPVCLGLLLNAAALLVIALGGGFGGALLPSTSSAVELRGLQFGYLVLGGTLLGLGTGALYPALIGAVADHVPPGKRAASVGVFRFWRDLGYAAGALVAVVADVASPEAALLVAAGLAGATGAAVHVLYRERMQHLSQVQGS